jgi:hemolysin III
MAIRYTHKEELWNSWSHAGGIALGVVVGIIFIVMVVQGGSPWAGIGVGLYLFGMLGSYIASTAYHALPRRSKGKERLRRRPRRRWTRYTPGRFPAFPDILPG